jgi:hypothetical protein
LNVNSKGETFSAESLFMALILQQQKMINHLIDELSKYDTICNIERTKICILIIKNGL